MTKQYLKYLLCKLSSSLFPTIYLRFIYLIKTRAFLSLRTPKNYNEMIQWLKLFNRNPLYTIMVDKLLVRTYIESVIGSKYLIPLISSYGKVNEIKWDELPEKYVIKCNHGSGMNIIHNGKDDLSTKIITKKINDWMKIDYSVFGLEWAYKNVKRKIIIEQYMEDFVSKEIMDYKYFCFYGRPIVIQVDYDRFSGHKRQFFDLNWRPLNFTIDYPNDGGHLIPKPANFDEMLVIAQKLSSNIPHVRVDLYSINGQTFFGELTFYPEAGYGYFSNHEVARQFGKYISNPETLFDELSTN